MADSWTLAQNDTWPPLRATLKRVDTGAAVDLTGATVKCTWKLPGGAVKVNKATAVIESPATAGIVRYDPLATDTDTVAVYDQEWEVTFADSKVATFPNTATKNQVIITDDLA
jgi:hypothetical protein